MYLLEDVVFSLDMTGMKDVAGMKDMTGVEDMTGVKDMTRAEGMKKNIRKLVVSFSPPSSRSSSIGAAGVPGPRDRSASPNG